MRILTLTTGLEKESGCCQMLSILYSPKHHFTSILLPYTQMYMYLYQLVTVWSQLIYFFTSLIVYRVPQKYFSSYYRSQLNGKRKTGKAQGSLNTTGRLLASRDTYHWTEGQHGLELKSNLYAFVFRMLNHFVNTCILL